MIKCNFGESITFGDAMNAALDILGHVKCGMSVMFEFQGVMICLTTEHDNIVTPRLHLANNAGELTDEALKCEYNHRFPKIKVFASQFPIDELISAMNEQWWNTGNAAIIEMILDKVQTDNKFSVMLMENIASRIRNIAAGNSLQG